jgi:hypothetical protein
MCTPHPELALDLHPPKQPSARLKVTIGRKAATQMKE